MLLYITIGVLVLSTIGIMHFVWKDDEDIAELFVIPFVVSAAFMLLFGIIIACNYIGTSGYIASTKQTYNSLTYQLENDIYDNDNDIGKKELYDDVQRYNETIAKRKALQNDFWLGVFYPDIYDQFELIEFK